jgi:arabinofuranan 3-O-arabinosyltransferase
MSVSVRRSVDVAVDEAAPARETRSVERMRLGLIMLGLALAVFGQSAGNTSTDTKIDLVVSPLRFLGRTLRLWDPIGDAGQLQNQSYGYLFPMGPFFAALHALGLAPWEIQRAWETALLLAAFLGTYLVARRLGIDSFWAAVGAGLVYALAPRTLSELTSISSELMPVAALPWVLLPLVTGSTRGSPRRAAARSGVALLFAGGVNAAATVAILPMPALWLLTRSSGRRRRALMGWWCVAVVLACLWWLVPLIQLGRYSPPFLDWIESSSTTTLPTSLIASLRGVDHWESYLGPNIWPAGWIFASSAIAVVTTTAVAGAGLFGMSRRDVPERLFLWTTLLVGLVLLTAGHAAGVGPLGADWLRGLMDGSLVPFRNIHKFDPLVRMPIALGIGYLLARVRVPREIGLRLRGSSVSVPARLLAGVAVLGVGLVAVAPVLTNHLVSSQRITTEPGWWRTAAGWLDHNSNGARALVVPGSASPQYLWGGTVDNALQPVATTPLTTRNAVPLTQAGYIRLLNEIEVKLARGSADPTLAPLLARAGIGYVVLANDLDSLKSGSTQLLFVRATLNRSPGLHLRAGFGPKLGGTLSPTTLLDAGATVAQPAVQIYSVAGWDGVAGLDPLTGAVEATGSTDALAQLVHRGLRQHTPVLFGADAAGVPVDQPVEVTTDGIRKREATFAGLLAPSVTLAQTTPYSSDRPVHDYLPDNAGALSAFAYQGIADVRASSAGDGVLAYLNRGDLNGVWSALDGDPRTAWKTSGFSGAVGQWIEVRFPKPRPLSSLQVAFADVGSALPTSVIVRTDAGAVVDTVEPTTAAQVIRTRPGSTSAVRITIGSLADSTRGGSAGITSLSIPGLTPIRTLAVPSKPAPDVLAFDVADGYRSNCIEVDGPAVCDRAYAQSGQEDARLDRSFRLAQAGSYDVAATVRLRGGDALDALLDAGESVRATGSSVDSADPRQRPGAAVDGDPLTAWQPANGDQDPQLRLRLAQRSTVRGVTIATDASLPVARPIRVTVTAGDQTWTGALPENGHVELAGAVRTRLVTITIDEASLRPSTNTVSLADRLLPVGVGEVTVDGGPAFAAPAPTVSIGCGGGIALSIDGRVVPLHVTADRAAILAGAPVDATPCPTQPLDLAPGSHRVTLAADDRALPVSVTLARSGVALSTRAPDAGSLHVRSWAATDRSVRVDTAAAALLVVRENANDGWQATLDGHRLQSVRVDGWEQGYVVPAGSHGVVHLVYGPQRPFEIGLIGGAVAALLLLVLAIVGGRRSDTALAPGRVGAVFIALGGTAAFVLLGGWAGLLTLVAVSVGALLISRSRFTLPAWLGGALLIVAALTVTRGARSLIFARQNDSLVQLLCLAALAAGVLAACSAPRQGRDP